MVAVFVGSVYGIVYEWEMVVSAAGGLVAPGLCSTDESSVAFDSPQTQMNEIGTCLYVKQIVWLEAKLIPLKNIPIHIQCL